MKREQSEPRPWGLKPRRLGLRGAAALGAGSMIGAFYIGSADISIATTMGARFGFELLWSYPLLGLAAWSLVDMCTRYFLRFGRTPMSLFKEVHWSFSGYMLLAVIVSTIFGSYSQWNASALMLSSLFPQLPLEVSGALSAGAALVLLFSGGYQRLERLFLAGLAVLIFSFMLSALLVGIDWGEAARGLVPGVPEQEGWQALLTANAGSIINAWLILIYPYTMIEKRWFSTELQAKVDILHRARLDYGWGILAGGFVAVFIMGAARAIARPFDIVPRTYTDFAALLEPVAGSSSTYLFLIGLFLAAWTSGVGWWVGGAYALLDLYNLPIEMNSRPMRACLLLFFIPSVLMLAIHLNPIYQIIMFAAFLAIVTPLIGIALIYRISQRDMGYFRWSLRSPQGALIILLDIFAVAISIYVGWSSLGSLVDIR